MTTLTQPAPTTGGTQPVTTYSYDSLGNETSASGALTSYGTWTFNSFSEPTSFVNSLNNTESWTYDSNGNLKSNTDFNGNVTSYTVDTYGNPLTMTQHTIAAAAIQTKRHPATARQAPCRWRWPTVVSTAWELPRVSNLAVLGITWTGIISTKSASKPDKAPAFDALFRSHHLIT